MFNEASTRLKMTKAAEVAEEQVEKIQNWCDEFRVFFGWKVNADYNCERAVFEVVGRRFTYQMVAHEKYLTAVVQDKSKRQVGHLLSGELNFNTFARIMIETVRLESAWGKTSWNRDKEGGFSLI